jgi:hypothetical protein
MHLVVSVGAPQDEMQLVVVDSTARAGAGPEYLRPMRNSTIALGSTIWFTCVAGDALQALKGKDYGKSRTV